jgi:hypothetical protein
MKLLDKVKTIGSKRMNCVSKLLAKKAITQRQLDDILSVQRAWHAGDINIGSSHVYAIVSTEIDAIKSIPMTTFINWLGIRGWKNVSKK